MIKMMPYFAHVRIFTGKSCKIIVSSSQLVTYVYIHSLMLVDVDMSQYLS